MLKNVLAAALLCSALAAPCLAQKSPWSFGFSIANASVVHPFGNISKPGSMSSIPGVYGGIAEKNYDNNSYSAEGLVQFAFRQGGQLRLRAGYSYSRTEFTAVYASPDGSSGNHNLQRETSRGWHLAPGAMATHQLGKFALHAGLELPFYKLGRLEAYSNSFEPASADQNLSENWRTFPGGFALGVGPLAGVSFQPAPWWSIGLELRSAWMYTHIEGNYEERSYFTFNQPVTGTAETYNNSGMSDLQVALQTRFSF